VPSLIASVIDAVAVASAASGAVVLGWRARRPLPGAGASSRPRALLEPWALFLAIAALALVNQIVFDAYVLAAHGGDPAFIRRYLGDAYFHLDLDFPLVRAIARASGAAGAERFLSPALLRVNALLELPFALLAYLGITRLFDRAAYRFVLRGPLGWLGAASFTIILCAIEIRLRNPWTTSDLVMRAVAFALVVPALKWLGRREQGSPCFPEQDGRPRSLASLLVALGGAASMAGALLLLYDLTLLYNLAHLRRTWPALLALIAMGTTATWLVPRVDAWLLRRDAGALPPPSVAAVTSVASSFALAFFVPALAVRYGLGLATSRACGLAVLAIAVAVGLARAARERGIHRGRWAFGLGVSALAGLGAVAAARPLFATIGFTEAALLGHAVLFLGPFLLTWRALELTGWSARIAVTPPAG
jgi:hypothetical protein